MRPGEGDGGANLPGYRFNDSWGYPMGYSASVDLAGEVLLFMEGSLA